MLTIMQSAAHSKKWYFLYGFLGLVLVAAIAARLYLGVWLLDYVNRAINETKDFKGSVQSIDIDLYRGAYRIHNLKLFKKDAGIPTPFINIETIDLSIQWKSILHGRIVSTVDLEKPVLNFAVSKSDKQTGADEDWTKPIKDLAPVDINHVTFRNGSITYQDFASNPKVDIYIHHMHGEVRNLRNVYSAAEALPSPIEVRGDSIGGGKLELKGRLNILKDVPDMDILTQLVNVSLPALNSYSNAYAALDFKKGDLSIYSELIIKNSKVSGYVKPIASHISLIDLRKDSNPLKVAWEAIATTLITIFTNQRTDQFATKAELEGRLDHIDTNTWSAIGGIISNAFIEAIKKGFDHNGQTGAIPEPKPQTAQ